MTDAPPIAPERVEAVMAAVSRSVRSAVSDPMRPVTLWQVADALVNAHPDYVDRGVRGELNRSGRERPGWRWLALVVGLYDRERVRTTKAEVVNTRLMLLGLARLDDEFDALLRRFRAHRRLGVAAAGSMLRPWARAAAATQLLPIWELEYDIFLNCCAVDRRGRWLPAAARRHAHARAAADGRRPRERRPHRALQSRRALARRPPLGISAGARGPRQPRRPRPGGARGPRQRLRVRPGRSHPGHGRRG